MHCLSVRMKPAARNILECNKRKGRTRGELHTLEAKRLPMRQHGRRVVQQILPTRVQRELEAISSAAALGQRGGERVERWTKPVAVVPLQVQAIGVAASQHGQLGAMTADDDSRSWGG